MSSNRKDYQYPHRLKFYSTPPSERISLEEFEKWALDRLRVLGEIEWQLFRNKSQKEFEANVKPMLERYLPLGANSTRSIKGDVLDEERKKDLYSHFTLRLAFCRTPELRKRFAKAECALFRVRFSLDNASERQEFVDSLCLNWENVEDTEKKQLYEDLVSSTVSDRSVEKESFFKVDWERVPDLVGSRRVLLHAGKAYVPMSLQLSMVSEEFSSRLETALEQTARLIPHLDEGDRILPILDHLSLGFSSSEFVSDTSAVGEISAAQIDGLVGHFPLCMRNLHLSLRHDRHLKHAARLQYRLFLKGIGLSVEQAVLFWRQSLSNLTNDKFNQEHLYNIQHTYGLKGSRINYKPYSCQQILTSQQPGPGDAHGCPYRHFSMNNLMASLESMGVRDSAVLKEVENAVNNKLYHVACTRVFEVTHGGAALKESINHPNMYFEKSYNLAQENANLSSEVDGRMATTENVVHNS